MKIAESHLVYLGLGSNLGEKKENIRRAIALIGEQIGVVERQSALYDSEPWGFESANRFVNAVVCVSTTLSPHRLLRATQRIERQLGKTAQHATERPLPQGSAASPCEESSILNLPLGSAAWLVQESSVYKDRPIDIDILLYDDLHIDTPKLKIPHPLMQERDFVMVPLREICPTYADPEPSR
ncbi:MAG: 2-amino-4-hydroxy-6-hydroxymethyldihydropteridine diphosphokinase [Prevotella sp.]|nr:2-amino-4-hydroxy-6-hydroxymethyldihydropteridine diphosphokinase [Prevotella sp.]